MTTTKCLPGVLGVVALLAIGALARADGNAATDDVVNLFPFTGTLEKDGLPVTDTDLLMRFTLYDISSATPDAAVWSEIQAIAIYRGRFTAQLGLCDQPPPPPDTATDPCPTQPANPVNLAGVVRLADDLMLGIELHPGTADAVTLAQRKRFVPVPYARWASEAAGFRVNQDLTVSGAASVGALTASSATVQGPLSAAAYQPSYAVWAEPPGGGGAAIVNDNSGYRTLMVVGNRSGGGVRKVGVWDDLAVAGNLTAGGQLAADSLRQRLCYWQETGLGIGADSQDHSVVCPAGRYMAGWRCYASGYIDGACAAYCCLP